MSGPSLVLPPDVLEQGVLRIDYSSFSKIGHCFRYAWHLVAHKRVSGERDPAQAFGRAIHDGLDVRQQAFMRGDVGNLLARMEQAAEQEFQGVELPEDEHRTLGRCKEVLGLYQQQWERDGELFRVLASERSGEKEIGDVVWTLTRGPEMERRSCKVVWQGRTDGIWQSVHDRAVCIKDTKTMKECQMEREQVKYQMNEQLKMYCELFSGAEFGKIREAVVDVIVVRKPLVKVSPKSLPRTEFHRLPLKFTDEEIQECKKDVLRIISTWLSSCAVEGEPPPMFRSACAWPKICAYKNVCACASEQDRMNWLYSGAFRDNTWNPMTGRE